MSLAPPPPPPPLYMKCVLMRLNAQVYDLFYCFTGCDLVPFLADVSKKISLKLWDVFPKVNKAFATLSNHPRDNDIHEAMPISERFVIRQTVHQ